MVGLCSSSVGVITILEITGNRRAIGSKLFFMLNARVKEMALLKEEALRDLVYAFAEIGDVNNAISYFNANGGKKYVERFLKLLAVTYVEQGKFRRAILSYKKLQTAIPFSDTAPKAQAEIISLNYELARYDQAWKELANFPKKVF